MGHGADGCIKESGIPPEVWGNSLFPSPGSSSDNDKYTIVVSSCRFTLVATIVNPPLSYTMAAVLRSMAVAMAAVTLVHATEIHLPSCLSTFQPFLYSGCYQEVDGTHILPYRSDASADTMTVESCVAECKGNGYRYAGLVYFGNCYCGQTVIGPSVDESECSYPCKGNSSEICGGNNIFSVYQDPTFGATDGTVDDYSSLGCWSDDSSLGRAVSYRQDQVDGATLTTEGCLAACKAGNFPFAGTEFGGMLSTPQSYRLAGP